MGSQAWHQAGEMLSAAGTHRLLFLRRILFFLLRTVFLKYGVWTCLVRIRVVLKCTPYTMSKYFVPCWLETESPKNWSSKEKTKTQIKHKTKCPKMEQLDLLLFGLCFCSLHLRCVLCQVYGGGESMCPPECGGRAWGVLLIYR